MGLWEKGDKADPKSILAEFIGSFLFQFLGGAAIANAAVGHGWETVVSAALGNGITMIACVYAMAKISGAHLNPAVSTGFLALELPNFRSGSYVGYVVAQILGAMLGSVFLWLALPASAMTGHHGFGSFCTLGILSHRHPMTVFFGEMVCTFALVLTVLAVVHSSQAASTGPIAIGFAYTAGYFAIGPYSGGSMNVARTIAPMILFGLGDFQWVYFLQVLGIMIGGFFAGKFFKSAFLPSE